MEESPKVCEQVPREDPNEDDATNVNHSARNSSSSKSGEFGQQKNQHSRKKTGEFNNYWKESEELSVNHEEAKEELEEGKEEDASSQIYNRDPPTEIYISASEENNFIMDASAERHEQPEQLQRSADGSSEAS